MDTELRDAAFGMADGGVNLAAASLGTPWQRWHAAVLYGVRGRYARAVALLEPLSAGGDRVLASLACSTMASHRRQLGGHAEARRWDARALRVLGRPIDDTSGGHLFDGGPIGQRRSDERRADGLDSSGAWFDAVTGLAADAVGLGDVATAVATHRAATRRMAALGNETVSWRTRVRLNWVMAEISLLQADNVKARRAAEHSIVLAAEHGARRHRLKSEIVLAASLGDDPKSRRLAESAVETAKSAEWDSLEWPAARVAAAFDRRWDAYAERIIRLIYLAADPIGRTQLINSQWVPTGF